MLQGQNISKKKYCKYNTLIIFLNTFSEVRISNLLQIKLLNKK